MRQNLVNSFTNCEIAGVQNKPVFSPVNFHVLLTMDSLDNPFKNPCVEWFMRTLCVALERLLEFGAKQHFINRKRQKRFFNQPFCIFRVYNIVDSDSETCLSIRVSKLYC